MGGSASAREAAAVSKTDLQEVLDEFGAEASGIRKAASPR